MKNCNEITQNNVYFGLLNIYDNIEAEINRTYRVSVVRNIRHEHSNGSWFFLNDYFTLVECFSIKTNNTDLFQSQKLPLKERRAEKHEFLVLFFVTDK